MQNECWVCMLSIGVPYQIELNGLHATICERCAEKGLARAVSEELGRIYDRIAFNEMRKRIFQEVQRQLTHVEKIPIPEGWEGDVATLAGFSRAQLMNIIESHWRVHHMGMPGRFQEMSKTELVRYIADVKGLSGTVPVQAKSQPKLHRGGGGGKKRTNPFMR